jgi:hypothetical protein
VAESGKINVGPKKSDGTLELIDRARLAIAKLAQVPRSNKRQNAGVVEVGGVDLQGRWRQDPRSGDLPGNNINVYDTVPPEILLEESSLPKGSNRSATGA